MKKIFQDIGRDLPASIVVFIVALPLCIGIAIGSNAPMFSGLIAGIIGGIVVGMLSGSQLSISGPAAGLTAIVASAILKLPTFDAFLLAVVLAGMFQVVLGFVKAGVMGDYVPSSVITGMLSAIGLILILKQIPLLLGYNASFEGDESFAQKNHENTFTAIFHSLRNNAPLAIIIGTISLLIQVTWDKVLVKKGKIFQVIPAPVIVVLTGVLINLYFQYRQHPWTLTGSHLVFIPTAESVQGFLSFIDLPDFDYIGSPAVWIAAITIALVASLETLLNIEAADELDPYKRVSPPNRELKAQGVGNMISGFLGGLPITAVIVRTSANVQAGAKTRLSAMLHGVWLLLAVAFIPRMFNLIPVPALAAVLIYVGYKLVRPSIFIKFYRKGFDQFTPFVITIVAILFSDLLTGIMIGILAGLFFVLRSNFSTSVWVVRDENKFLIRLRKDVSFLNKPILKRKLEELPPDCYVLIDATRATFIDKDVIEVINDFLRHAHLKNIHVEIKRNIHKPMHQLVEILSKQETALV